MKKTAAAIIAVCALAPLAAFAQSSDDVILNLLSALDTPLVSPAPATPATVTTPIVQTAPKQAADPAPAQVVLTPFHLFDLESNVVKPDPRIESLKSVLQAIIAQFAAISASSTPALATSTPELPATTSAPVSPKQTYLRNLDTGSRGEDVRALQNLLIARGFLFGEATGYFGILTKTAVLAFQTDQGLPPVGTVGPRTRALLNTIPTQVPGISPSLPPIGQPAIPFIASSTSVTFDTASSTAGTSTPQGTLALPVPGAWGKPVTVSISILPTEAPVGGSVSITWLSQNADSCVASDGWGGSKPTIGAAVIEPLQFSLNFTLTCTGAGGVASTSALVVVGGEQ